MDIRDPRADGPRPTPCPGQDGTLTSCTPPHAGPPHATLSLARTAPGYAAARQALDALPALRQERLAQIRERMAEGFYARPQVLTAVAARIHAALADDLD